MRIGQGRVRQAAKALPVHQTPQLLPTL